MLTYVRKAADYSYILQSSFKGMLYTASKKLGYFHQYPDIIPRLRRKQETPRLEQPVIHPNSRLMWLEKNCRAWNPQQCGMWRSIKVCRVITVCTLSCDFQTWVRPGTSTYLCQDFRLWPGNLRWKIRVIPGKFLVVLNDAMKNLDYLSLNSGVYIHVPLHTGSSVTRYATVIFSRKNLSLKLYFDMS